MGQSLSFPFFRSSSEGSEKEADIGSVSDWSLLAEDQATVEDIPFLRKAQGSYWYPVGGERILDACGGAGVSCLGHGRKDILEAIFAQMKLFSYVSYAHFRNQPTQELSDLLIESSDGAMKKVYVMCSGTCFPL